MSSTSKPPEIMTYEDMWSEAIPEYYKNAGYTSKEAFCRDHQRVKKQIEESVQPQESSSGHGSIFWALASTSVQVGGQAAALAFAPAALIATAVDLLIKTGKKHYDVVSGMEDIREKSRFFFQEISLREQQEKSGFVLQPELKKIDFDLLCSYLRVCGLIERYATQTDRKEKEAYRLDSKKMSPTGARPRKRDRLLGRFSSADKPKRLDEPSRKSQPRVHLELFFNLLVGENELDKELEKIVTYTKQFDEARSERIRLNAEKLVDHTQKREQEELLEKSLKVVKNRLIIRDERCNWTAKHERLADNAIEGMGDWITCYPRIKEWSDFSISTGQSVLKLQAPMTHGKTYLCHRVISHLRDMEPLPESGAPDVSSNATHLAYYYLGNHGSDEEEKPSLRHAVTAIVWQFVQADMAYRKSVAKACEPGKESSKESNLWDLLKGTKSSNFLIILDGLDHAAAQRSTLGYFKNFVQYLGCEKQSRCRILLSGSPRSLECIKDYGSTIDLTQMDEVQGDVELFVKTILDDDADPTDGETQQNTIGQDSPEALSDGLVAMLRGGRNYDFINFLLGKINPGFWPDERLNTLANDLLKGGDFSLVKYQIRHLSQFLGDSEARDLNELIPWLVLPNNAWPTLKRIEEILVLSRGGSRPRWTVKAYVTETFNTLLNVKSETVSSEHLSGFYREHFKITNERSVFDSENYDKQPDKMNDEQIFSSDIENLNQRMKDSLLHERLEESLEKEHLHNRVYFDPVDGHIRMITACLRAAFQMDGENFESLLEYSARWLPWHLDEIHPKMLSASQKSILAENMPLLRQLFDKDVVRRWFKKRWIKQLNEGWFSAKKKSDCVMKWLHSSGVASEAKGLFHDADLLGQASEWAAILWFEDGNFPDHSWWRDYRQERDSLGETCKWVVNFLNKESRVDDEEKDQVSPNLSIKDITQAESWAQMVLNVHDKTDKWNLRMVAVLLHFGHDEEAMTRIKSIADRTSDIKITRFIAAALLECQRNIDNAAGKALGMLQPLFNRLKLQSREILSSDSKFLDWNSILYDMFRIYSRAGRFTEAIDCCQRRLDYRSSPKNRKDLLNMMFMASQSKEMIERLQALAPEDFLALFESFDDAFYIHVAAAAAKVKNLDFAQICRATLKTHGKSDLATACLRLSYGIILTWTASSVHGHEAAMEQWVAVLQFLGTQNLETSSDFDSDLRWLLEKTARNLGCVWLRVARTKQQKDISEHDRSVYFPFYHRSLNRFDAAMGRGSFTLARFYQSCGHEQKAANVLKPKLDLARQLLSDDDDSNDCVGYEVLACLLTCLDKCEGATLAWRLAFGYEAGDDAKKRPKDGCSYLCDGFCGAGWERSLPEDLYFCKDCVEVSFDQRCFEKLMQGTLGYNQCDKDHDFLRVPKWDAESALELKQNVPDTKSWVEGVLERLKIALDEMCTPKDNETDERMGGYLLENQDGVKSGVLTV
ncbi:uncharacterized protein BKA78DRAFT_293261 [Phyllosticta capitalensis]|uniref:uncharacterized protein n=1 Tax=Phyllosticta capitalensis TaxID=121624 RepID=UPI003131F8CF